MKTIEKEKNMIAVERNEDTYGIIPERPLHLSVKPLSENPSFMDGIATYKELEMELDFAEITAKMPFVLVVPKAEFPSPAIILIGSTEDLCSYVNRWINKKYAIFFVNYEDVSENNDNFKSGLSLFISPTRRKKSSAGKIAVWAWAALRVLEYAEVLDGIDKSKIGIAGKGIFALSAGLTYNLSDKFSFVLEDELPEMNKNFLHKNSHLFSPKFSKTKNFDNNN